MTSIIYKDIAPGARENVVPKMDDIQPFCDLNDLKTGVSVPKVATLEQDYWRLDGTFGIMQDDRAGQWGVWSQSMTGADGIFATAPVLTLSFPERITSVGASFQFDLHGPTWCNDLNISWYNGSTLLDSVDYAPDKAEYSCINLVQGYDKLVITFRSMSSPYRYLKISDVLFGYVREFGPDELRSADLYQAVSPISEEVEINTLNCVISSHDDIPFFFQRKQELEVYQNGQQQGVFYITASKRKGVRMYQVDAEDMIGLMADSLHMGGVYNGELSSRVIADIMGDTPYTLASALRSVKLYGWLPVASRRDNLAQVAFAIGAAVDTSGSDKVRIYPQSSDVAMTFDESNAFEGMEIDTAAVVTKVEVTEHTYRTVGTEDKELYKDELDGIATVTFDEPMHSLSISGGYITESGANYAVISGTGSEVTLTGSTYRHDTRVRSVSNPDASSLDKENVVKVTDATLVSKYNSVAVAQRVFEHYQCRDTVTAKLLLGTAMPGDVVSIQTEFDGVKTGTIQSIDISLARKRIGRAVILCQ